MAYNVIGITAVMSFAVIGSKVVALPTRFPEMRVARTGR